MPYYTCRHCSGTGSSLITSSPMFGNQAPAASKPPPCPFCHGTGRVDRLEDREPDAFDLLRRLVGRARALAGLSRRP